MTRLDLAGITGSVRCLPARAIMIMRYDVENLVVVLVQLISNNLTLLHSHLHMIYLPGS